MPKKLTLEIHLIAIIWVSESYTEPMGAQTSFLYRSTYEHDCVHAD
jgi:hypothetical protein